ncbi:MAG TPA: dienelactone hydrolase family protein [Nitrosopumilaceae archaeon]|nr:dienelactone hydrolase family protein [Nitrosopumilaceae archaeon]
MKIGYSKIPIYHIQYVKYSWVVIILFSIIIGTSHLGTAEAIAYFPPPLKQINDGIEPTDVTCAEGLELVLKFANGKPACLKPSSVSKLIERGWAIHVLPNYEKNENNNSEIFKLGEFSVETENVTYFQNSKGYLAKPSIDGQYPAVIMIHEWWGLNENIRDMAEKLASHGYIVFAVDLYDGQVATTSDEARELMSSFDEKYWIENMNLASSYVQEQYAPEKMGSIGWCFGGGQSLSLALNSKDVDATVIYYGQLVTEKDKLSKINWPILGIFADLDQGITPQSVGEFEAALNDLEIPNDIYIYPDVNHAFANPSGERYAPEASMDAWQKTIEFLEMNLK